MIRFEREGLVNLWRDWKDELSIRVKEHRTWKHQMVLRTCLITKGHILGRLKYLDEVGLWTR